MQNKHLSTVNSKVKLSEAAEGTVQKSSWTNHGNTDLSAELTKEIMRRASLYTPLKSERSVSKIYYFISDGVKQEPLKLWRLMFLLLLLVLSTALTSSLWLTNVFWLTVRKFSIIQNNSISFDYFEHLPVEHMTFCIYVYNYTNVEAFYGRGEGEEEEELEVNYLGPYCFKEKPEKRYTKFHDNHRRLSYKEASVFHFDTEGSNGTLSDMVTVPNFPYLVTTALGVDYNPLVRLALATHIRSNHYQPFIQLNTSDFFFGYDDPLMDWVVGMAQVLRIKVPFTRFGLLAAILKFINVEVTVDTGYDDVTRVGRVAGFKGAPAMSFWKTPACNSYQGGEGTFWNVDEVGRGSNVQFFATLLCRNLELRKSGEVEFLHGATVPRYELIPDMFDNRRENYDCYCRNCTTNILELRQCLDGFPFKATFPKFYGVAPEHLTHLKGLPEPDPQAWTTMFDIHPYLGITLRFKQRMQLNLDVRKASFLNLPPKIKHGQILPTVSLTRDIHTLRPDATSLLYHALTTLPLLEAALRYGGVLVALYLSYVLARDCSRFCNLF